MNSTTKYIIGIIIVVIVIAVGYSLKGPSKPVSTEPIKIGFVSALTGEAGVWGEQIKTGFDFAV
jgi:ABC-type branched-subunit amino acid transport system substrate-binding protein